MVKQKVGQWENVQVDETAVRSDALVADLWDYILAGKLAGMKVG